MNKLLTDVTIAPSGGFTGVGTGALANPGGKNVAIGIFTNFISAIIGIMTIIAIIWTIFTIITGAISIISSGGDKAQVETAKKKITTGVIGLVVVIIALVIIGVIGSLFGMGDLLNLPALFKSLAI